MKWREHAIDVQNIERDSNEAERYAPISTSDDNSGVAWMLSFT